MLKLGVNIDHVATLREARYRGQTAGEPCPVEAALTCEAAGAHGITAHLREDRRHIQDADVRALRRRIGTRLNLEMAIAPEIVRFALKLKPDIVCLVPEKRQEVTTEGGLEVARQLTAIKGICKRMGRAKIEVSLFINPDARQVDAAAEAGAQFVELHTGQFAEHYGNARNRRRELNRLIAAAEHAQGPPRREDGSRRQVRALDLCGNRPVSGAPSSGEEPASPRHRAGIMKMAWRTT